MNQDPLDSLLRRADPASGHDDPLVDQTRLTWQHYRRRRSVKRRKVKAVFGGAAAMLVFAILAIYNVSESGTKLASHPSSGASNAIETPNVPVTTGPAVSIPPVDETAAQSNADKTQLKPLEQFCLFVDEAGAPASSRWVAACRQLAFHPTTMGRSAVNLVPQINDPTKRERAIELVLNAAGNQSQSVLTAWLDAPSIRYLAWDRLLRLKRIDEMPAMVPLARSDEERTLLCQVIARSEEPVAVRQLLELAQLPLWRKAVRHGVNELHAESVPVLIQFLRSNDREIKLAAAFVVASVPNRQVDNTLAELVLHGWHQQPAYIALLSRNTPNSRAFIARAATQPHLSPSLHSARVNFAAIEKSLQFWIDQTQGQKHETPETSHSLSPESIGTTVVRFVPTGISAGIVVPSRSAS
ncbi:hypothetical protein [Rhodopirellula sp. MGV]|uniref:hypothetical protein n=1 Tax=Rhodopirellula sp. MGV TaxID=2023130 RepID=UPI000BD261CC|nr:hypothetical protein [Rhodopirellula sp. MGV]OYP31090.1 hypothetical protein CGZ80_21540 [Rhodopirellula sp. MGV]